MVLRKQYMFLFAHILSQPSLWNCAAQPLDGVQPAPPSTGVCEHRSLNYLHNPSQSCHACHRPSAGLHYSTSLYTPEATHDVADSTTTGCTTIYNETKKTTTIEDLGALSDQQPPPRTFISFEDWRDQRARVDDREAPQDKLEQDRQAPRPLDEESDIHDGEPPNTPADPGTPSSAAVDTTPSIISDHESEQQQEPVVYKDEKYRSKDAGKTCKERFSYSSFDAGATVLKTNEGAKNAKAILVENKDSYMLLECAAKNKFVIVELTDDILVDTVVLANFEFFSSMIRHFRVSVSGRYPVKLDKWTVLGTFEAKNSRDIQPFLVPNPLIWAKYARIEFLSHYGNEYYCPVSLLRIHGTRMLDSWMETEASPDDEEHEQSQTEEVKMAILTGNRSGHASQLPGEGASFNGSGTTPVLTPMSPSAGTRLLWLWSDIRNTSCPAAPKTQTEDFMVPQDLVHPTTPKVATPSTHKIVSVGEHVELKQYGFSVLPMPADDSIREVLASDAQSYSSSSASSPPVPTVDERSTRSGSVTENVKPSSQLPHKATSQGSPSARIRDGTSSSPNPPSPTVQGGFHEIVSKRLQLLETNVTLSLRYLEDQSRILQESQHSSERTQLAKVDSFLNTLNSTVLSELRTVRQQYDQIWQSTVAALEIQKEQSQRELLALSSRLNILAEEVVFQKRMAIIQAILLLCCLVLVIFSRVPISPSSAALPLSFRPMPYLRPRAASRARDRLDRQAAALSGQYSNHDNAAVRPGGRALSRQWAHSKAPLQHRSDWGTSSSHDIVQGDLGAIYEEPPPSLQSARFSDLEGDPSRLLIVGDQCKPGEVPLHVPTGSLTAQAHSHGISPPPSPTPSHGRGTATDEADNIILPRPVLVGPKRLPPMPQEVGH